MNVKKINEGRSTIDFELLTFNEEDLYRELDYYLAQNLIADMFLLDLISIEEYQKIRSENIKVFSPILSEIME